MKKCWVDNKSPLCFGALLVLNIFYSVKTACHNKYVVVHKSANLSHNLAPKPSVASGSGSLLIMMIILAALLQCVPVYDCLIDGGWVTLGCTSLSPRPQQHWPDSQGSDPLRCLLTSIPHTLITWCNNRDCSDITWSTFLYGCHPKICRNWDVWSN